MRYGLLTAAFALSSALHASAYAAELEVTHWWTSGGEAAAVAEFAKAFDASGHKWIDGAVGGGGPTARTVFVSRLTGGDPMGATQFNHGRQAEELVEAGLMRDLTDIATEDKWLEVINPPTLLDGCTVDGKIYCVPINIHSWQWLWLSHKAFEDVGLPVPKNWDEFVAAAPKLREAGKLPLALGSQPWQSAGLFQVLMASLGGPEIFNKVYGDKDAEAAAGEEIKRVFAAAGDAREMAKGSNVQDWNQATNLVITGQAGGQVMGDWAQGDFQVAGQVAGKDYSCLPGLGVNEVIATGGDAFYFPVLKDEEKSKAQVDLVRLMLSPEVQVAFNLKKGSLPVRGDIDLNAANDCMKKGLEILAAGKTVPAPEQLLSQDTITQINDLMVEFFSSEMSEADAQTRFADIIAGAD